MFFPTFNILRYLMRLLFLCPPSLLWSSLLIQITIGLEIFQIFKSLLKLQSLRLIKTSIRFVMAKFRTEKRLFLFQELSFWKSQMLFNWTIIFNWFSFWNKSWSRRVNKNVLYSTPGIEGLIEIQSTRFFKLRRRKY